MRDTQKRFLDAVQRLVEESGDFEFANDPEYSNTGTISAPAKNAVSSPYRVSYQFNQNYASFKRHGRGMDSDWRLSYVEYHKPGVGEALNKVVDFLLNGDES